MAVLRKKSNRKQAIAIALSEAGISKKTGENNETSTEGKKGKGLRKLPKAVRNKMGFKKRGGKRKIMAGKGLYANIHAKRKRGGKMRKKGAKGAPTAANFRRAAQTARKKIMTKLCPRGKAAAKRKFKVYPSSICERIRI